MDTPNVPLPPSRLEIAEAQFAYLEVLALHAVIRAMIGEIVNRQVEEDQTAEQIEQTPTPNET